MGGAMNPASPLSAAGLAQLSLSLIAVVGVIFAISWLLKRLRVVLPRGRGAITVIDQLQLGPRERILLISVGDAQVLIGVGQAGMVALTPLATPIAPGSAPGIAPRPVGGAVPAFAERLRELMRGPGGAR
jgi:flagellar protein FliO/FliZ